jgi:hypothetical protein
MNSKMETKINLPLFGEVVLENEDWEYKYAAELRDYNLEGRAVNIDIHFKEMSDESIKDVSKALTDLKKIKVAGDSALAQDYKAGGETKEYISEWNEDIFSQIFSEAEFSDFIGQAMGKEGGIEEQLFSLLRLVRVGIYERSEESFATLDYAFGNEMEKGFLDDMVIVKLNQDYEVCEITREG